MTDTNDNHFSAAKQLKLDCNANVPEPCQVDNSPKTKTGTQPISIEIPAASTVSSVDESDGDGSSCCSTRDWLTELAIIATSPQSPLMDTRKGKRESGGRQRQRHHSEGSVLHKPSKIELSAAVNSLNRAIHTYAKPPRNTPSPPPLITSSSNISPYHDDDDDIIIDPVGSWAPESDARISSSSPFPALPKETDAAGGTWSHPWPTPVWKCFLKGNRMRFTAGQRTDWRRAEEIGGNEFLAAQASLLALDSKAGRGHSPISNYAPLGLRLVKIEDPKPTDPRASVGQGGEGCDQMKLTFHPDVKDQSCLEAICSTDHPFFVQDKGWSSYIPCQTVVRYGIPCSELEIGDVCIPLSHPDATSFRDSDVLESFKSYHLTPMDSSAVLALSSMARHRKDLERSPTHQSPSSSSSSSSSTTTSKFPLSPTCPSPSHSFTPFHVSPGGSSSAPSSPTKTMKKLHLGAGADQNKGKRPMNAFMLFAKKFRLEYTQLHPDKDNRAISVILGNKWKKMRLEERKVFSQEAKHLADEHKKIHPDCWKRKRAHSTSSAHS